MVHHVGGPHQVGELLFARHDTGVRLGDRRGNHVVFTPEHVIAAFDEGSVTLEWDDIVALDLVADTGGFRPPPGFQLMTAAALGSVGWHWEPKPRLATVTLLLTEDVLRLPLARTPGRGFRAREIAAIETFLRLCLSSQPARATLAEPTRALELVRTIAHRGGGALHG